MKKGLKIIKIAGICATVVILISGISLVSKEIKNTKMYMRTAKKMSRGIAKETLTTENALYNYEWFKKQEASIQSLYKQEITAISQLTKFEESMPEDRTVWDRYDKTEHSRLSDNVTAITNTIDNAIAEYEAKSNMANKSIFKDLPTTITRSYLDGLQLNLNGGK